MLASASLFLALTFQPTGVHHLGEAAVRSAWELGLGYCRQSWVATGARPLGVGALLRAKVSVRVRVGSSLNELMARVVQGWVRLKCIFMLAVENSDLGVEPRR